ncbi:hypothetical protein P43SY_010019 [Pythium insidiosum]|uniref:Transmembrane protein n=1 Tax=Pythium insidiosum TaxID=114742 RepID=A0AAD5L950_PYTIN|nr:hypothetical protein P43SY_010019 [Pythium insidiosum]
MKRPPADSETAGHGAETPRTSFCLLEAPDDRDSALSSILATGEQHQQLHSHARLRPPHHAVPPVSYLTPPPVRMPTIGSISTARDDSLRLHRHHHSLSLPLQAGDAQVELFPLDSSVFANPDNVTPSLQTSMILGESVLVGQDGALNSLHPANKSRRGHRHGDRRRPRPSAASLDTSVLDGVSAGGYDPRVSLSCEDDTIRRAHSDTSTHESRGNVRMTRSTGTHSLGASSSDMVTLSFHRRHLTGLSQSAWCWCSKRPEEAVIPSMSVSEFASSLWSRLNSSWDSYFLYFTLVLALASIPIAVAISAYLDSARHITIHSRCNFAFRATDSYNISTSALAAVFIPFTNNVVMLFVSLWIGIFHI